MASEIRRLEKAVRATKRQLDDIGRAMAGLGTAERAARRAGVDISVFEAKMALIEASRAALADNAAAAAALAAARRAVEGW